MERALDWVGEASGWLLLLADSLLLGSLLLVSRGSSVEPLSWLSFWESWFAGCSEGSEDSELLDCSDC